MNCELCGTPVKIVGNTTKHYEPLEMPEMISELIYQRSIAFDEARDARKQLGIAKSFIKDVSIYSESWNEERKRILKLLSPGGGIK